MSELSRSARSFVRAVGPDAQEAGIDEGVEHALTPGLVERPDTTGLLTGQAETRHVCIATENEIERRADIRVCAADKGKHVEALERSG